MCPRISSGNEEAGIPALGEELPERLKNCHRTMSTTTTSFYVTGGTMPPGVPSYVERQADQELYEGLVRGEYCYVLTSRQMGKSSLMVRAAARLREEGAAVVVLDLTAIGQNLSADQWYGGLLRRVGRQLDPSGELEEALEEFWFNREERVGPLERWMQALEQVILPATGIQALRRSGVQENPVVRSAYPARSRASSPLSDTEYETRTTPERPCRLVIFIDEIDAVRSLPFSTDEFFAAIRECYNRRSQQPDFARLTFCLLGVATPSDLIQDPRTTPFNIGRRIELTDFTAAEAAPLARGLEPEEKQGRALLDRILYWTGGHPYLTQRLCQAVASASADIGNPKSKIQNRKWTGGARSSSCRPAPGRRTTTCSLCASGCCAVRSTGPAS
jgi:hypothetical protein